MTVTTTEETKLTTGGNEAAVAPTIAPIAGTSSELVESDLIVEDVSIDGMCGVY